MNQIDRLLEILKNDPRIRIEASQLDSEPNFINFLNGTLDLRTGELHAHDSRDFITKIAAFEYHPPETAEERSRFQRFVSRYQSAPHGAQFDSIDGDMTMGGGW